MAAHFSAEFLDELRARLPVSAVVGRRFKLRKEGKEFRAIDDNSLTVNDGKQLWYDQSKGAGGDIFKFEETYASCTFPEAVERCAALAGVPLPNGSANGSGHGHPHGDEGFRNGSGRRDENHRADDAKAVAKDEAKREIEVIFDYRGADGALVMQVVRYLFKLPDSSYQKTRDGKRKKLHLQRRPDGEGGWIWKIDGVTTVPYRLPELIEAIADDRTVFVVEGEKKADALAKLGFVATCNPAGAGKWPAHFAEHFAGARVVIMPDNDEAGRKHADQVGANLIDVATSVMLLELPDLPPKGDVVDWIAEGGTADDLAELVGTARPWEARADQQQDAPWDGPPGQQAPTHRPRFRMVHFGDIKVSSRPRYLVRGLIPLTGVVVIWGPPKCGKSFWTSDLLFHVALGWPYRNRKVEQGAVVYVILEGETGFSDRIEAFRQRFLEGRTEPVPFYVISQRLNLVADQAQLIADIRAQLPAGVNPAVVAIDTLNRSLQGSESSDQDMGNYVKAADAVRTAFHCVVPIVHHCGIESARPRGHSSLTGAADAQISIRRDPAKNVVTTVEYMKDGPEGDTLVSKLQVVNVGREPDGHPITSCVVVALGDNEAREQKTAAQGFALRPKEEPLFRALMTALRKAGVASSPEMIALGVPEGVMAAHYRDWREAYKIDGAQGGESGEPPSDDTIRKRWDRDHGGLVKMEVIGWKRPWVWWTGKHVRGFPETKPKERTGSGQWSDRALDDALSDTDENRTDIGQGDIDELFGRN